MVAGMPSIVGVAKPKGPDLSKNLLFYGDYQDVMRKWIRLDRAKHEVGVDAAQPAERAQPKPGPFPSDAAIPCRRSS